jgi:hypothetical protein
MKRNIAFSIFILSSLFFTGCYYDVVEELYPVNGSACDTSGVTYSLTVKPILDQNCNGCHSQASQQGGVVLETHSDVLVYANSGQLLGSIKHSAGYAAMPQGGAKLSDCNILKIEKWIQDGSPDN